MEVRKGVEPRIIEDLFNGRGRVSVWSLLEGVAEPFTAVLSCELAPNGVVGRHVQEEFTEIVVGLGGDGEALVDGRALSLRPGDVAHLPLGSVLELRNRSSEHPLTYLIVKARSATL
jgi:quercetin dioxygenase-like cupin family protein